MNGLVWVYFCSDLFVLGSGLVENVCPEFVQCWVARVHVDVHHFYRKQKVRVIENANVFSHWKSDAHHYQRYLSENHEGL